MGRWLEEGLCGSECARIQTEPQQRMEQGPDHGWRFQQGLSLRWALRKFIEGCSWVLQLQEERDKEDQGLKVLSGEDRVPAARAVGLGGSGSSVCGYWCLLTPGVLLAPQ